MDALVNAVDEGVEAVGRLATTASRLLLSY
jgi:hypothetical protein